MTDNRRQIPKEIGQPLITPVQAKPAVGESSAPQNLGQINAARRKRALIEVRRLIKEHHFTVKEIERDQE